VYGHKVLCLALPLLIATKRAAGRPKDLEVIAELEALMEERASEAEARGDLSDSPSAGA
jgi:hypothetical protein